MESERKVALTFLAIFLACWFLPVEQVRFNTAVLEALALAKWYAREHVILCLIPAFFIAGAIGTFISQDAVLKYLGGEAKRVLAYGVASVSGSVLAVCSCTVLPLFAGIYKRGAGLGPASAFLYAGPAINVLAMILTARVLGLEMGIARAVGAIFFAVVIGLIMQALFRREEEMRQAQNQPILGPQPKRSLWQDGIYFALMVGILVFANFAAPDVGATDGETVGIWASVFRLKWFITAGMLVGLVFVLKSWFDRDEIRVWTASSWDFAKMILPLLFFGVLIAGLLLGRPGHEGLIPAEWVQTFVGGNSIRANVCAAIVGSFMYFATLTEVPILEGLMGAGMGKGPALALLLAGPALSLPNMLVIRSVLGTKKTLTYIVLVVLMSALTGIIFGAIR